MDVTEKPKKWLQFLEDMLSVEGRNKLVGIIQGVLKCDQTNYIILFCGPGSGKTTLQRALAKMFRDHGCTSIRIIDSEFIDDIPVSNGTLIKFFFNSVPEFPDPEMLEKLIDEVPLFIEWVSGGRRWRL